MNCSFAINFDKIILPGKNINTSQGINIFIFAYEFEESLMAKQLL